jgi:hypothetical protein
MTDTPDALIKNILFPVDLADADPDALEDLRARLTAGDAAIDHVAEFRRMLACPTGDPVTALHELGDAKLKGDAEGKRVAEWEGKLEKFQRQQGYNYIGKNMKPVLARDLEDRAERAEADLAAARAEIGRLTKALRDARDMVQSWSGYASDYFKDKHDLAGDLAELDAALAPKGTNNG